MKTSISKKDAAYAVKVTVAFMTMCAVAVVLMAVPRPASAATNDVCAGFPLKNRVNALGGRNSLSEGSQANSVADLQSLFIKYEDDLRQILVENGLADAAEPLFGAVANGEGISEGTVTPGDSFQWMAWRKRGKPASTNPTCLAGDQSYDTFEIEVPTDSGQNITTHSFTVPKICLNLAYNGSDTAAKPVAAAAPAPAPVAAPNCAITVDPASAQVDMPIEVAVSGSWQGGDIAVEVLDGTGVQVMTVAPPYPNTVTFSEPGTYTLRGTATNSAGASAICETQVVVDRVARWTLRPFLALLYPTGDDFTESSTPGGVLRASNDSFDDGFGAGISAEYHFSDRLGLEAALILAGLDSEYMLDIGERWETDEDDVSFASLTIGPNFHLTPDHRADLYVGPFIGLVNLGSVSYNALGETRSRDFDNDFVLGAQIGIDVPFSQASLWNFHAGLLYMDLTAEDKLSNDKIDVDPLIFTLGLARHF
ncbi:MAG: outer membrane beta-barrel protein [Gammaproteobacteria bacterium]|nr:outer membrane beta-barrel protein [Gammaproteobacteria bacterium]MDH3465352.1 outer membrane beta-barrel protein [Gammaproteobacteria bacterium]